MQSAKFPECPSHSSQPEILGQETLELDIWAPSTRNLPFTTLLIWAMTTPLYMFWYVSCPDSWVPVLVRECA